MNNTKTNPILLSARKIMTEYSRATGTQISINNENYEPILELQDELFEKRNNGKNICLFCMKHKKLGESGYFGDLQVNPCREMHINAIKKSQHSGSSHTYVCPMGFIFWTSPIYLNGRFTGALLGSGFMENSGNDTFQKMRNYCNGMAEESELMQVLKFFPQGDPGRIKALAELMSFYAQSLSHGSEDVHESRKKRSNLQSELAAKIEKLKNTYPQGTPKLEYPLDKERELIDALCRGDTKLGRQILNDILAIIFYSNKGDLKNIRYRAIELVILLLRVGMNSPITVNTMLKKVNRYLIKIKEAKNIEELTDALYHILDEKAGQIDSFQGMQHASSLKKVKDYILKNIDQKITLEEIASVSGFSAPYFCTIFKEEMGENFSSFLNRLRVEKACTLLTGSNFSLCRIARSCGYDDQSWFSKTFKAYTGISPGKYRNQGGKMMPKIPETGYSSDYFKLIKYHAANA